MLPGNARQRRVVLEERLAAPARVRREPALSTTSSGATGASASSAAGIAYQYAREVFPDASFLKLGMAYPFPAAQGRRVRPRRSSTLLIVEELDPFLEEQIRALPDMPRIPHPRQGRLPGDGRAERRGAGTRRRGHGLIDSAAFICPPRSPRPTRRPWPCRRGRRCSAPAVRTAPPSTCSAALPSPCPPPRAASKRERVVVTGDIGCYTLGALPPLGAMDTCSCMGASIGTALGMEKAGLATKVVAVIGDSTFFHSGITGLVDVVTSGAATTVVILDNGTTAMTGRQPQPRHRRHRGRPAGTAASRSRRSAAASGIARRAGHGRLRRRRPSSDELKRSLQTSEPDGAHRARALLPAGSQPAAVRRRWSTPTRCNGCGACLRTGCPALVIRAEW